MPAFAAGGRMGSGQAAGGAGLRRLKLLLAILLLPLLAGYSSAGYQYFVNFRTKIRVAFLGWPEDLCWFLGGAGLFALVAILLWRPLRLYALAHESVHALATWACLGRVSGLRASARGGQVNCSKSNTLIRLAPYGLPLYAALCVGAYLALDRFWQPLGAYRWAFSAVLGAAMAFHLGFTCWSLRRDQPDLQADGWFFSLLVIYLANLLALTWVLGLILSGSAAGACEALSGVLVAGYRQSWDLYAQLVAALARLF